MPLSIARYGELANIAERALKRKDLKTIETINKDDELRAANMQFVVRNGQLYLSAPDVVKKEVDSNGR